MFTITDICDIAVQIERNGEATYRQASEQAGDLELARVLGWIADEERRHAEWFEAMRAEEIPAQGEHAQVEAIGRALLRDMLENQTFSLEYDHLTHEGALEGLITQSIEFENDTILFYEMLRGFMEDSQAIQHLDLIIAEEHGHVTMLEKFAGLDGIKGLGN